MIVELYGLTGSGKTFLAGRLEKKGLKTTKFNSKLEKYANSILFIIKNPVTSFSLFLELNKNGCMNLDELNVSQRTKLKVMRNILLLSTMARYNKARSNKTALIDEGFFQMIHTIYEKKKNFESIKKLIEIIPNPDTLIILNIKKQIRVKRLKKRNLPREDLFGAAYFNDWHKAMESNDKIIRNLLKKNKTIKIVEIKNDKDTKN